MFISLFISGFGDSNINAQTRLVRKLFEDYDRRVIPQFNESTPVSLSVGIDLLSLVDLVGIC